MICAECNHVVADDDDYVEIADRQRVCGVCVDQGINPNWAGPRDIDRSQKQSEKIKEARTAGSGKYEYTAASRK